MGEHRISADAWAALREFTEGRGDKLEGENSQRNEDGTYTVELDDEFEARLKTRMFIGETVEGFILRCLKKNLN